MKVPFDIGPMRSGKPHAVWSALQRRGKSVFPSIGFAFQDPLPPRPEVKNVWFDEVGNRPFRSLLPGGPIFFGVDMARGSSTTVAFEIRPDGTIVVVDEMHVASDNDA